MKIILCSAFILVGLIGMSQETKSQRDQLDSLKGTSYIAYRANKKNGSYEGGLESKMKITSVEEDKSMSGKAMAINMESYGSNLRFRFDDYGFPVTFVQGGYAGIPSIQEKIGFTPEGLKSDRRYEKRLVIIDGIIYCIRDWYSKDKYYLEVIFVPGKHPTGFKAMKLNLKSIKKMKELDPAKKLQDYLDAAFVYKKSGKSKWLSNASNKLSYDGMYLRYDATMEAIKNYNKDYENSDYYKRVVAHNARMKEKRNTEEIELENKSGRTVYYWDGSNSGTNRSSTNGSTILKCERAHYYSFSKTGAGALINAKGKGCGTTFTVK